MPRKKRSAKNTNVMRLFLAFILLVFFCFSCNAQKLRKLRLIEAKWDESINADIIPNNIYKSKAEGLIMSRSYKPRTKHIPQVTFSIYWPSPHDDGYSMLIITGKQIILTTGHDNPNLDYLYWFVDISKKQHEVIVHNITVSTSSFKEYKLFPYERQLNYKYFIPEKKHFSSKDCEYKRFANAKKLIEMFNKGIMPGDKIIFPTWKKFRTIDPLVTAWNANEINDSLRKEDN